MKKMQYNLRRSAAYAAGCFLCLAAVNTAAAYERIVSATGNASETIVELGLADKLVAVDTTSTLPKTVMAEKPKIGYRRRLSSEGILSMQPDLLILAPDAGPPTVVEQIKAANVPTITIKDEKSINGVIADIQMIAEKLEVAEAAKTLIERIRADEKAVNQLISDYPRPPKMVFLMDGGTGQNRMIALGKDTAGDAMINIVGGKNVFAEDFKSIKPVSAEAMVATDMDMIIIASHGGGKPGTAKIDNATADYVNLALTKAAKNQCVFRIGTVEALGFGPGVAQAAKEIAGKVNNCVQ